MQKPTWTLDAWARCKFSQHCSCPCSLGQWFDVKIKMNQHNTYKTWLKIIWKLRNSRIYRPANVDPFTYIIWKYGFLCPSVDKSDTLKGNIPWKCKFSGLPNTGEHWWTWLSLGERLLSLVYFVCVCIYVSVCLCFPYEVNRIFWIYCCDFSPTRNFCGFLY